MPMDVGAIIFETTAYAMAPNCGAKEREVMPGGIRQLNAKLTTIGRKTRGAHSSPIIMVHMQSAEQALM